MKKNSKILVIGHKCLAGRALCARLRAGGCKKILTMPSKDAVRQDKVERFFKRNKPDYVFFMDIRSGGIIANATYPAEFMRDNLQAQMNVIDAAYRAKVTRLLFMASSCTYPKECRQPMKEEYVLTGALERTNEAYAVAKIAGMKLCQYYNEQYGTDFICAIPATTYGPGDDFDARTSHVIPALMRKIDAAKAAGRPDVVIWGSGSPRREFIYVDDLVDAILFIMERKKVPAVINIGSGSDISIKALAGLLKEIIGFEGRFKFDRAKPDGAARKLLDAARLRSLGWRARTGLKDGLQKLYGEYKRDAK